MPSPKPRRLVRYERRNDIRFLTFSCFQRLPLLRGEGARDVVLEALFDARSSRSFELFGWVIMPSHVHLLLRPNLPQHTVPAVLRQIKEPAARRILREWRERDAPILDRLTDARGKTRFWLKGGGYDRNIFSPSEFREKLDYIHLNPVKAELVERAADWRWSSAAAYRGDSGLVYQPDLVPPM